MKYYDFFTKKEVSFVGQILTKFYTKTIARKLTQPHLNSILEIGPGKGHIAQQVKNHFSEYVVIEENLKLSSKLKALGFTVYNKSVPPLPFEDSSFDCILLSHVFEHINSLSTASLLLKEINRVLKPNGRCILICPDFMDQPTYFYEDYTHQLPITPNKLRHILVDHSFSIHNISFLYGGLPYFPGYFLNILVKLILFVADPIVALLFLRKPIVGKFRTLFSRAIYVEAIKQ